MRGLSLQRDTHTMKKTITTLYAFALCIFCISLHARRVRFEDGIKKYPGGYADPRCRLDPGACSCWYEKQKRFYPNRRPYFSDKPPRKWTFPLF